jgi:alkylation response protein AidB-like acyl-CoA dehydrogenase
LSTTDLVTLAGAVAEASITPHAAAVDAAGRFPTEALAALASAGLLGAVSSPEVGGAGADLRTAGAIVERVARACASTGMILCMHYTAAGVIEKFGAEGVRRAIARGEHVTTLAFSESGSRSHFWAPVSTATANGDTVTLNARKSWVTTAHHAHSYVWSSRPLGDGASTIWLVPTGLPGLAASGGFDGIGLRGNDSCPVAATDVRIPAANRLGPDGGGFDVMMGVVLPTFAVLSSAVSVGIMEAACAGASAHCAGTGFEHLGAKLADLPTIRAYLARMRIRTDQARLLLDDTVAALGAGRADAMLRVLEVRASSAESAQEVTDLGMRVCGGAAFRKELGVDRNFRDARAAGIMAPTTDVLYDFIGKAVTGLPLF